MKSPYESYLEKENQMIKDTILQLRHELYVLGRKRDEKKLKKENKMLKDKVFKLETEVFRLERETAPLLKREVQKWKDIAREARLKSLSELSGEGY